MKKIVLSVAAIMAFGFASAQEVKFGVKGGANFSTLTGDIENVKSIVGFQVGGFAEIKISEKFAIQPELLYSAQGTQSDESDEDGSFERKLSLGYLNIPVMAKFYVAEKFSLEAGPQIGFLLSAKEKAEGSIGGENISVEADVKDGHKSIDFGVNFGAGYDFTENLSVGIRYNLGLSNIYETGDDSGEEIEIESDAKVKNSVFSLSVGYKF